MTKRKSDLFTFFNHMNSEDYSYVDSLSDEEVKDLSAYVVMMWVLGASSQKEARVILTNDYVNQYFFTLSKHPRLLLKLLVSANGLGDCRYEFTKTVGSSSNSDVGMIAKHYQVTDKDARDYLKILPESDLKTLRKHYKEFS